MYDLKNVSYNLYNKIRHSYAYSRPNGWTDWAEYFCGHSGGVLVKNSKFFFLKHLKKKFPRATPGPSACWLIVVII